MPLYEYGCAACGATSEINHRMSDPSPTDCPVCGKPELSKMISAAGFRLKGAGWYETDFKSDGKRNLAGDTEPPSTKPDPKPSLKSTGDSQPAAAAKTETKAESKPAAAPAAPAAAPSSPGPAAST